MDHLLQLLLDLVLLPFGLHGLDLLLLFPLIELLCVLDARQRLRQLLEFHHLLVVLLAVELVLTA